MAVVRLVKQFEQRNPALREAAIRRLLPYPGVARPVVFKTFREGSLAARLAALEVLEQWKAPLAGLDPWRPETFTPERLAPLAQWTQRNVGGEQGPPQATLAGATGRRPAADRAHAHGRRGGGRRHSAAIGRVGSRPAAGGLRAAEGRRHGPRPPPAVDLALSVGGPRFACAGLAGRAGTLGRCRSSTAPEGRRRTRQAGRRRRKVAAVGAVCRPRSPGPRDQPPRPATHRRPGGQRRTGQVAERPGAERPRRRAEAIGGDPRQRHGARGRQVSASRRKIPT